MDNNILNNKALHQFLMVYEAGQNFETKEDILFLKRNASAALISYHQQIKHSGGNPLLVQYVNKEARESAEEFDRCMEKLKKEDKHFPKHLTFLEPLTLDLT